MENPELAAQILERLKQLGVGLSCDDFGTGYSSLSNLRRLPFDTLKIDRAFLEAEIVDERAYIILRSIVALAHELELVLVAEGIELQEHIDRLSALGCEYGQGFFIGQPMSSKQVIDALNGVPYSGAKKSAMVLLWERMVGEREEQNVETPAISTRTSAWRTEISDYDLSIEEEPADAPTPEVEPEMEEIFEELAAAHAETEIDEVEAELFEPEAPVEPVRNDAKAKPDLPPVPSLKAEPGLTVDRPDEAVETVEASKAEALEEPLAKEDDEHATPQTPAPVTLLGERLRRRQRRRQGGQPNAG